MRTSTSRWLIAGVLAIPLLTSSAPAQPAINSSLDGVYNGSYTGPQGLTKFKLTITRENTNGYQIRGVLTLYLPGGSGTNIYTCDLDGTFISRGGLVGLRRTKWESAAPSGLDMAGIDAVFNARGGNNAGQISGRIGGNPAYKFEAIRDAAESANLVSASASRQPAGAAAAETSRGPQTTATSTTSPPALPRPVPDGPTAINGAYTGTYGSNTDDMVPAKLYIKHVADGYAGGALTGLFTFDVPAAPGGKPITYTYKLTGRPGPGIDHPFQFWSAAPLGRPAPDTYALHGLEGGFAKTFVSGRPTGPRGRLSPEAAPAWSVNPDQISGTVRDRNNRLTSNKFEMTRDNVESAKLDSSMATLTSAAGAVVSTTTPAPAPAAPGVRPTIEGVYNGTYTRTNQPPAKFKLTITQASYNGGATGVMGLAGMATIYLPADSGLKAYTYSLKGTMTADRNFSLNVYDWETIRPKDFSVNDLKGMGFFGTFLNNANLRTARIISVQAPNVLKFEATRDATESADIKGTIAAQKAVRAADEAAALKTHADALKNAQPKQLAVKGLVRKSRAYWSRFENDLIRQVFDGGFADDVNDDLSFQLMFTNYVDLFSKHFSANLPANHRPITIVTTTYRNGYVVNSESKTIDIDPRFIAKYCEFSGVTPEAGTREASDLAAKEVQIFRRVMQAGSPAGRESNSDAFARFRLLFAHPGANERDLSKFFATETGSSAAMRQLGENFLRGATGKPSLQEAGVKIQGADAETDKDLPPGRFTHLIDAANAFLRDPANAPYRSRYETTFYMLLVDKYRGVMTPEEEYYYANDFAVRFRDEIEGPRANSSDPAWPRLHPAVEETKAELGR
ncbi:MAG TPA: hypothetical protein VGL72_17710 [Bryobacteraceae bacterium]